MLFWAEVATEFTVVFVDCLEGWRLKLNILAKSFPNYRARDIYLFYSATALLSVDDVAEEPLLTLGI